MKLGLIARCDDTGLGNQTKEIAKMLNPDHILLIDSTPFHHNNVQHTDWYDQWDTQLVHGLPDNKVCLDFIKKVDVVFSCETFYNNRFVSIARAKNKKTILQYNYEFLDYLQNVSLELPDLLLSPSPWKLNDVVGISQGKCRVDFLPPPSDHAIFKRNAEENTKESKKILHVAGKPAANDRNGTESVLKMLEYSKESYEIVIKSQYDLNFQSNDPRVSFIVDNTKKREDLYYGFDAMILPRRYAGLCLPMNEALLSGLPVFMTDISPNDYFLPPEWLASSQKIGELMTRTMLDIYEADPVELASKVDRYMANTKEDEKEKAFNIGYENFSAEDLTEDYEQLINSF
jgi:hypothetical protein